MPAPEIRRSPVLSTGHASEATAKRLDETPVEDWPCLGGPGNAGGSSMPYGENAGVGKGEIPADLFAVIIWVHQQGCDYVLLDCDGDEVGALPRFDQ